MTKNDYVNAGYKLSLQVEDAEVARAEREVVAAYIVPIIGEQTEYTGAAREAIMALSFFLLCKRKAWATRSGGTLKATAQSVRTDAETEQYEMAKSCHFWLERVRQIEGANACANVEDVCGIYYKTNFISL